MTRRELLCALAAVGLAACGTATRDPAPVTIRFGQDECAYCRMTIDERHLAAEFVEPGGRAHKFGEPGCLVNWMRNAPTPAGVAFVTDAGQGGWLLAATAVYVLGQVRTPMAYDVAAYRSPPAGAAADAVRDWRTLLAEGVTSAPR